MEDDVRESGDVVVARSRCDVYALFALTQVVKHSAPKVVSVARGLLQVNLDTFSNAYCKQVRPFLLRISMSPSYCGRSPGPSGQLVSLYHPVSHLAFHAWQGSIPEALGFFLSSADTLIPRTHHNFQLPHSSDPSSMPLFQLRSAPSQMLITKLSCRTSHSNNLVQDCAYTRLSA